MMTEEATLLYQEALVASEDLRSKLSKVKIKIDGGTQSNVIQAITNIFGNKYITERGDAYLTYDMYCIVVNLIRDLGGITVQETL